METQKIVNLWNDNDNESSKFVTRKLYVINDENKTEYGEVNENDSSIKFETKAIKPSLCDYSAAYILVTGDRSATNDINDKHIDTVENLDIIMPMYKLIEYCDNIEYCDSWDTSRSLWQSKRDEQNMNNINPANVTIAGSTSSKYKSRFFKTQANADNEAFKNAKTVLPLKYLSNFWKSLEMPLIDCKVQLELNWTKNCI